MEGKRSYTVPILLLMMTGLAILLVLFFSKLLIAEQAANTEAGKRLAEKYQYALLFADRLHSGSDLLLREGPAPERLKAKMLLGEAVTASGETVGLLAEAVRRHTGQTYEEAYKSLLEAMTAMIGEQSGKIYSVAEHEGPLTGEEKELLLAVRDAAAGMKEQLTTFRLPNSDAGYRNMAAGEGWSEPALKAADILTNLAGQFGQP